MQKKLFLQQKQQNLLPLICVVITVMLWHHLMTERKMRLTHRPWSTAQERRAGKVAWVCCGCCFFFLVFLTVSALHFPSHILALHRSVMLALTCSESRRCVLSYLPLPWQCVNIFTCRAKNSCFRECCCQGPVHLKAPLNPPYNIRFSYITWTLKYCWKRP